MAQLGGDSDSKTHRCRGLTEGATEEVEENNQGKLKRSRKTALTLGDLLETVQKTDELSIGSGFTTGTNRPQGTLRYQPSVNRDINSPHNDALFYFFLRNLDELLADFKSSSADEDDSESTQAFTIRVRPL